MTQSAEPLLRIEGLSVSFDTHQGALAAVSNAHLDVFAGESIAIVGQSGSGKSTLVQAVLGLLPPNGHIENGRILFRGRDLVGLRESEYEAIRGAQIGLVPQDPLTNLDPLMRVGKQVVEGAVEHGLVFRKDRHRAAAEGLERAGLQNPAHAARQYPNELSGGMRQRALIASATLMSPQLLIADEPTSALDVTVQKRILDQLGALVANAHIALLFVTHDLALAAERAHRVVVMNQGEIVEQGEAASVLTAPAHEYTRRLVEAAPALHSFRQDRGGRSDGAAPRIELANLVKTYEAREETGKRVKRPVVDGVSISIDKGQTLAIVGESGSGKTTVARSILRMLRPDSGEIRYDGQDILSLRGAELRQYRRQVQPIFQDPSGSLNPRFSVFDAIAESFVIHHVGKTPERRRKVADLLDQVGMPISVMDRRSSDLSGGQKQRVAIARAIASDPQTLVCDEVVSALDVLVQAQILDLLTNLQRELGLTYVFISHDLAVVRQMATKVMVMQAGKVVESGDCEQVFLHPQNAYTRDLLASIPGASGAH